MAGQTVNGVRRGVLRRMTFAMFGVAIAGTISAAEGESPNIVLIMADDLGYGDIGSYGQKQIQTPNLDKLAADGIRFTSFYSGSTVCAPSRAALLTGQHTGHTLIRGNGNPPLPTEPVTLGPLLKKAGYTTAIFGKWGMGGPGSTGSPVNQGMDEFIGFLGHKHAHEQYPTFLFRGDQKVDLPEGTYANDMFTSDAVDFIRRRKAEKFFLFLSYTIPHQQMLVPSQGQYADKDWPELERIKAAMITRMDSGIGQVMQELEAQGLSDNTLVLFTSDNGPHAAARIDPEYFDSNGPLRGIKRDLYEGGIRVPLIARFPAKIAARQTSDQPWAYWDLLPTFLDLAGGEVPTDRDGISMKQTLLEGTAVDHDPLYWEFYERGFTQAVRKDHWKLIKTSTGTLELYNLDEDIGEKDNLSSKQPEKVMELLPLLTSMRTDSEHWDMSLPDGKKKNRQKQRQQQNRKE